MGNYLKMPDRQRILALLELGWSYRRIEKETGIRRGTVSAYDPRRSAKPANPIAGSGDEAGAAGFLGEENRPNQIPGSGPGPVSACEPFRAVIEAGVQRGLTAQRIWQDLCEEHGFAYGYLSVQRFVRGIRGRRPEVVDVMEHPPGKEAQVDYFQSPALALEPITGKWRRPWIFRMTLSCSRHGYEEALWCPDRRLFLRAHEYAFLAFSGVPEVVRPDYVPRLIIDPEHCRHRPEELEGGDVRGHPGPLVTDQDGVHEDVAAERQRHQEAVDHPAALGQRIEPRTETPVVDLRHFPGRRHLLAHGDLVGVDTTRDPLPHVASEGPDAHRQALLVVQALPHRLHRVRGQPNHDRLVEPPQLLALLRQGRPEPSGEQLGNPSLPLLTRERWPPGDSPAVLAPAMMPRTRSRPMPRLRARWRTEPPACQCWRTSTTSATSNLLPAIPLLLGVGLGRNRRCGTGRSRHPRGGPIR